jgi:hypothetical protein
MKILISWIAQKNDFGENGVNENGPTLNFYKYFFEYERHLLLSSAKQDDTRAEQLASAIRLLHPDHAAKVDLRYMAVDDVIDIGQIKEKVETLLLQYGDDDIDIFYSPGTSAMQVAWYICHTTLGLHTRLMQVRPANKSSTKKPERIVIDVAFSAIPVSAVIREESLSKNAKSQGHLLVPSIQSVYDKAEMVARTDKVTTLINGSSGTGVRNNWPARSMSIQAVATLLLLQSIVRLLAINCWNQGCLDIEKALLQMPQKIRRGSLKQPTAARSSWMRSAMYLPTCSKVCLGYCRNRRSCLWAPIIR